jgi:hypothetical protein
MPSFGELITAAQTRWDAAVVLLSAWNARPAGISPVRNDDDFLELVDEVRAHFDSLPSELNLSDVDRSRILDWTDAGTDAHKVDAVGFGLNFSASAGFAQCWRDSLGDRHRPSAGDVYPCADAPWPSKLGSSARTPSPRSMNIDPGDHPFARTFRTDMLPVEFDFTLWRPLYRLADNLDAVAAPTVNETLGELGLDVAQPVAFPVSAVDPALQEERVLSQLDRAIKDGAHIVVFPELSTSAAITASIEARLADDDDQRLVICGSWHEHTPPSGDPANVSIGLISGLPARMNHRKIVEFGNLYPSDPDTRLREGIVPPDPPLLHIYVANQFRFAVVICKDFLHAPVTRTLDAVGANVLLVPALSRTTQPFKARALAHTTDAQSVSVVANGPRTWDRTRPDPTALLARPYEPEDVLSQVADAAPSQLVFSMRQATARRI